MSQEKINPLSSWQKNSASHLKQMHTGRLEKVEKLFPLANRFAVGYVEILNQLDDFFDPDLKPSNYPPHDVRVNHIYCSDDRVDTTYEIILAVAGFEAKDISIELFGNTLCVHGNLSMPDIPDPVITFNDLAIEVNQVYVHSGIAKRDFSQEFLITDNMKIASAVLNEGVLVITLEYIYANKGYEQFVVTTKEGN